jgi:hypothetical protein
MLGLAPSTMAGGAHINGPTSPAELGGIFSVAKDNAGNIFFTVPSQNSVFKLGTSGQLTVLAGIGTEGFNGDGGPAASAELNRPLGVAVDTSGNVLVADSHNGVIRRVDASTGYITTIAGGGHPSVGMGDEGPATRASLNMPAAVAVDSSGNLFIADSNNQRIRRVDATTGIITTVAGSGPTGYGAGSFSGDGGRATAATLSQPTGLAVDGSGNLFITDPFNHRVRRVSSSTGIITTVAGNGLEGFSGDGGPGTRANLAYPEGVAIDSSRNLLIADTFNQRIRRLDATSGTITTIAGNGTQGFGGDGRAAAHASLDEPSGLAVDTKGILIFADTGNTRIRLINLRGVINTLAGTGSIANGGPGTRSPMATVTPATLLFSPTFVEFDKLTVGNTSPVQSITVTNTSTTTTANFAGISVDGLNASEFNMTNTCGTSLAPGASCSVNVQFTPGGSCEGSAQITFNDDASGSPQSILLFGFGASAGGLSVSDMNTQTPSALASLLVGSGVTVSNVTYSGATRAGGTFTGGNGIIGFDSGITLSTGSVFNVVGPNCSDGITTANNQPGDADLAALIGIPVSDTFDAAALDFDFVPTGNNITFQYVFSSDEYNEFANSSFNDVFGLFINGTNAALLPGTSIAVSVNNVNGGNPIGTNPQNSEFYVNNDFVFPTVAPLDTEMDGMTVVLTVQAQVNAGTTNHIKLAIADTGDDALDSNVFIAAGTLSSSAVTLTPASLAFGNQAVQTPSATQTVTLKNTGAAALTISNIVSSSGDYTLGGDCPISPLTLGANLTCSIAVTFTPTIVGPDPGKVTITDDAGNIPGSTQSIALSGTGTAGTALLTVTPSPINFGNVSLGTTMILPVIVTNTGTSSVTVSGATVTGAGFSIAGLLLPLTLTAGQSAAFSVVFTPTVVGTASTTLTIVSNATNSPLTIPLSGTAVIGQLTVSPPTLSLPGTHINQTCTPGTVTVTNISSTAVGISNVGISGPFVVSANTCPLAPATLAAGASCAVSVTYVPTAVATQTGTLTITSSAVNSSNSVGLTAVGLPSCFLAPNVPAAAVMRGSASTTFTVAHQACSAAGPVHLSCSNQSPATCAFSPDTLTSPDMSSTLTVNNLQALTSDLKFQVHADASLEHLYTGLSVDLMDFMMASAAATGTVNAGQTASYALAVASNHGLQGMVSFSCSGAPAGATCTVSPQSVTLNATGSSAVAVKVTTTARSMVAPPATRRMLPPGTNPLGLLVLGLMALLASMLVWMKTRALAPARLRLATLAAGLVVAMVLTWAACGGTAVSPVSSSPFATPSGTYSLTVTGTYTATGSSTQIVHNTTLTLTVH